MPCIAMSCPVFTFGSSVQKRLGDLGNDIIFLSLQPLYQRRKVASLSLIYRSFQRKFADELHNFVQPVLTFTTGHATHNAADDLHFLCTAFPDVYSTRENSNCENLLYRTLSQEGAFLITTILFKSRTNRYHLHIPA